MSSEPWREKLLIGGESSVSIEGARPAGFEPGRTPALVLAPGAGSDLRSPLLLALERELAPTLLTARFNFPYREAGRRAPDPQPRLERCYLEVLAWLRAHPALAPGPIFAGGRSMGGRIATHLAAAGDAGASDAAADAGEPVPLAGLVLLGYPLHPPGQPERLRDRHLARIRCPLLFVQGTRDAFAGLDLLRPVLDRLAAPHRLHLIEDGDHAFKVPKRSGRGEAEVRAEVVGVVRDFVSDVVAGRFAPGGRSR